jgi:hypothetical protein
VIARHPVIAARLAARHVEAAAQGCRHAMSTIRADLADAVPPPAIEQAIEALEAEQARLLAAARGVALVEQALRGRRFASRL